MRYLRSGVVSLACIVLAVHLAGCVVSDRPPQEGAITPTEEGIANESDAQAVEFFGVRDFAEATVFVIDRSVGMRRCFPTILREIGNSVSSMSAESQFHVILEGNGMKEFSLLGKTPPYASTRKNVQALKE